VFALGVMPPREVPEVVALLKAKLSVERAGFKLDAAIHQHAGGVRRCKWYHFSLMGCYVAIA